MTIDTALLLLSAFLHATWNLFLRRADDRPGAAIAMMAVASVVSVAWAVFTPAGPTTSGAAMAWTLGAGIAEGGYFLSLGRAMRDAPLGLAYAVSRGGAMLIVWPVSLLFLGERASVSSLAGALGVSLGLALATPSGEPSRRRARLRWSWATAACIAGYHLAYGRALALGVRPESAVAASMTLGVALASVGGEGRRAGRALARQPARVAIGGVLAAASFLVFLVGLSRSHTGYALSLRNTSIAFAVAMSAAFGERVTVRQWAGLLLVIAGAWSLGR